MSFGSARAMRREPHDGLAVFVLADPAAGTGHVVAHGGRAHADVVAGGRGEVLGRALGQHQDDGRDAQGDELVGLDDVVG